ncbi:methyl-accepting chemotaxis protein [Desulfococcaceae bacterium HSG8]|nr:methyl-accepting chemotaxis protein [Desulfococcaceae bacterium HSG8]
MERKKKFLAPILNLFRGINESIRNKLMVWLLVLGVFPLFILGFFAHELSKDALRDKTFENLQALKESKANAIRKQFEERHSDMNVLKETVRTLRYQAFKKLASMQKLKKSLIESYFNERMNNVNILSKMPLMAETMAAFKKSGSVGTPEWRNMERIYGSFLVNFTENYGYYDTFLVSTDGGILYTAAQESDLGQNLKTGDLKDGPAGQAFQKGLTGLVFQDFGEYEPAGGVPASFIAAPIKDKGETIGVVMVQVSIDQINSIMQERTGMGETGGTYLVGPDRLFRSDSVHIRESTVMNPAFVVDTMGVSEGLAGKTGEGVIIDYRGEYTLSSWTPVNIHGVVWAMLAEIDVSEAFVPVIEGEDKDFFSKFKERYGYTDLYLINPDGYLFFSVEKGEEYQTNIMTGPYMDSNLGKLITNVLEKKGFGMADFKKHTPARKGEKAAFKGEPAAFIALPVLSDKKDVEVVLAAQLSVKQINAVMSDRTGLGKTGETYLVGPDKMFRSQSIFWKDAVMNPKRKADTEASRDALAGRKDIRGADDYRGIPVMSAWSPVTIFPSSEVNPKGVKWAVIAKFDESEVEAPVTRLFWFSILIAVFAAVAVALGAFALSRGLTTQVEHIMDLFGEIGIGNFEARTPVVTQDELGTMAFSLNAMLDNTLSLIQSSEERDAMQSSVMKLLTEISELAEGDLTKRAEVTEDFTGAIADSFNDMAEQIGRVVWNVKDVTLQVSATSKDVSASTENLAETSEMQAVQVSDAIAAINEMATSIRQVAENAGECSQVSEDSTLHAKSGAEAVRDTNGAMESIREHVQETARAIKRLGESSQEIGNIVQLINDIADRTSILALNASIQAAMAGDAGRGFAVVAEEVQRLAERSTNATKQIDTLIKNIQGEISEAGTSMEESIQRVVEGSHLADGAYEKLEEIENVTVKLGELIQSISMASKQQARASENIAKTMEEVGEISSQTSAASRQTAISMKELASMSDQLNDSVSVFKVEEKEEEEEEKEEEGKEEEKAELSDKEA